MGPREDGMTTYHGEQSFWSRLHTIPVIQSTIRTTLDLYSISKEKPIIGRGLGVLEYGVILASNPVKKVASTIVEKYPVASTTAHKLDSLALNCLETLESTIPAIQKSPTQIVTNIKKGTTRVIHSGVRRAMKSFPGRHVVWGLDSMITWSERTINGHVNKDAKLKKKSGVIALKLRNGAVMTLKQYLRLLNIVKQSMASMAGVRTSPAKPRPNDALGKRRLASPRKLVTKNSWTWNMVMSTMAVMGLVMRKNADEEVALHLSRAGSESPDNSSSRCEKRKHKDDETDSESETETMNLSSALDQYDSGEDSDYWSRDDPSAGHREYVCGTTENDLGLDKTGVTTCGKSLRPLQGTTDCNPPEIQCCSHSLTRHDSNQFYDVLRELEVGETDLVASHIALLLFALIFWSIIIISYY